VYRFPGTPSGSAPAGLADYNGTLYGTTTGGGAKTFGTVFVRSGDSTQTLYSFQGGADGAQPEGSLVAIDGVLYGTTEYGGSAGDGTVFSITPSGNEHVVYSFKGGTDGATPILAGLGASGGKLYGTTNAGGDDGCRSQNSVGCGTLFVVTTSGVERVLHRFTGKPDGAGPAGTLIASGGAFYGTTSYGGHYDNGCVFKFSGSSEQIVYSFKGYPDGATPYAGLTVAGGDFFGTTALGGAFGDAGTIFELTPSGTERVLYSFKGAPDGALPYAGLTLVGGTMYGTTMYGGSTEPACVGRGIVGCGIVFDIDKSGRYGSLYRFKGHADGEDPWSPLVFENKLLYGTTLGGGTRDNGTLFQIQP
jgi:uncharacterized repeat protein (TIGR03803 family)